MSEPQGDRISIRVGGDVSGQLTAGRGNTVSWNQTHPPITEEDLTTLRAMFDELRTRVEAEGGEQAMAAREMAAPRTRCARRARWRPTRRTSTRCRCAR